MRFAILLAAIASAQDFATIPPGAADIGCEPVQACAASYPKKRVEFPAFQMMKHEVTVAGFRKFVKATGYKTEAEQAGERYTWQSPEYKLDERQPALYLSLNDAKAYCASIGARVPFEAEWEYAARAGTTTYHYWGEEIDERYLWYFNNTDERPERVGRKLPNAWGLYDVEGNAMEWTLGGAHSTVTHEGWGTVRGGSYASCPEPYPPDKGIRQRPIGLGPTFPTGKNSNFRPDMRRYDFGVRCAK